MKSNESPSNTIAKHYQDSIVNTPKKPIEVMADEEEEEDPLLLRLAVNHHNHGLRKRALQAFMVHLFNRQHKAAHVAITRGDFRKRQVFFYWYSMMDLLREEKQALRLKGDRLSRVLEVAITVRQGQRAQLKDAYYKVSEYTSQMEVETTRNQQMWSKVNCWLNEAPPAKMQAPAAKTRQAKGILKNKSNGK